ncbi:MAG: ybgF [Panacagrimonas sp.]|jgi:tol-pal system protein YbgF|nr:tol-pal system protein YbgF [Panacagrimonas sp.]MCC2655141.1 ybgF [Panacagrimonas sp.]
MTVRRVSGIGAAFALVLLTGGCASDFGGPISNNSKTVLSPAERRLQEVETKTAQLVRRMDSMNATQTDQDLTRLRDEIRFLRGDVEKLRFDLDNRDRSTKELFSNLDRRVAQIEAGGGGGGAAAPAGVVSTAPGTLSPAAPRAAVASPEEERAYLGTFDLLKNGKYDDAIRGFRGMLDQWPQGRYADNGWYWMGEAQMVKRDFNGAANSFQSLVQGFPSSPKVADGLYKLGLSQIELKKPVDAKAALQRVIREYPSTNAANLAKQKLDQLGG